MSGSTGVTGQPSGKKRFKELQVHKSDFSNTKCVSMKLKMIPKALNKFEHSFEPIPTLGGEEKIKDLSSNGKNKTPSIMSGASRTSDQGMQYALSQQNFSQIALEFITFCYLFYIIKF